jgi:hypothetical protein
MPVASRADILRRFSFEIAATKANTAENRIDSHAFDLRLISVRAEAYASTCALLA